MPMAHMTVRYATTRARVARTTLVRLDPQLKRRRHWTIYLGAHTRGHVGGVAAPGI